MNLLQVLIPNFFEKEPIPDITNQELLAAITRVQQQPNIAAAMQEALDILSDKYESRRFSTWVYLWKAYEKDPNVLWTRRGFLHCTQQNYLFRILMVKSGKLSDDEITFGHSFVWYISPHQYLKIRMGDALIAVDTWNYQLGAKIDEYAAGFGVKRLS